jgi:uncharacterized protein (DUF1501 family)
MAVIRSMSTKEGDHGRGSFLMRTGNLPLGPIRYPAIGALVAKELGDPDAELPCHVSILPPTSTNGMAPATSAGFLGPGFAPVVVGESLAEGDVGADQALRVPNLLKPVEVGSDEFEARVNLLRSLDQSFARGRTGIVTAAHEAATARAARMVGGAAAKAFRLDEEPKKLRDAYGRSPFGQGCLLARRLVERGVPFVEVSLDGWDSHAENFDTVSRVGAALDAGWSTLVADLEDRKMLDTTLMVWMGEFGRTPRINSSRGRDHYPTAWSTVLAGGGIKGGQAVGKTSRDGTTVEERPVSTIDLLATVCKALGIDPMKQNLSNVGRPIRIVDKAAKPITEVLA